MNDKQLDELISLLYEAAIDSSYWQKAIGLCGQYVGGVDTQLFTIDKESNMPISAIAAETTFSLSNSDDYVNHYSLIDPRLQHLLSGSLGEWRSCYHHINSEHFVNHNEFYQDFFIPLGARYSMASRIEDNEKSYSVMGIVRAVGQRPFDEAEQLIAKRFTSHLQKALRLSKQTQALQMKAELGAMAIDALALSMIIVDSKATVLHSNAKAREFLSINSNELIYRNGCLTSQHSKSRQQLLNLISSATSSKVKTGGAMALQCNKSVQVFITPLPAASKFSREWQIPLALVLVVEIGKHISDLQLLAELYDLSPTELRVMTALLNGKSPENYACEAGVSINTVRTQLRSLFRKTGTRGQAELVVVLSQLPPLQKYSD